tara:strand:+ start:50115 stop:50942 length:828 start_codon:yes stop_codon:yes gene_type:complete
MKFFYLTIFAILFLCQYSFSFETGCSLQPSDLNDFGTKVTQKIAAMKTSLPKSIPLQSEFEYEIKDGQKKFYGTFEGFFRPQNDDFFSVIPLPILGFDVTKDRIVLYICAHYSDKKEESHLTIYFLRGYHLDPPKFGTLISSWIYDPQLKVKPVPATLLGIGEIKMFFIKIFRYIPFVDIYFETISMLQRFVANMLGDVTGFGVERIELTEDFLRVSSGVDLKSPREARISKTFKLKRPELGTGAAEAAKKTFNAPDEKVIHDLETNHVDVEEVP